MILDSSVPEFWISATDNICMVFGIEAIPLLHHLKEQGHGSLMGLFPERQESGIYRFLYLLQKHDIHTTKTDCLKCARE